MILEHQKKQFLTLVNNEKVLNPTNEDDLKLIQKRKDKLLKSLKITEMINLNSESKKLNE